MTPDASDAVSNGFVVYASRSRQWEKHLKWLEEPFKGGARCYGSCAPVVAGAIFNLEHGLNVPQDEDITHPEGFFRGMPTWDKVMALPYQDRMRAFRDPEIRKAMSAEAVEGTIAQQGRLMGVSSGCFESGLEGLSGLEDSPEYVDASASERDDGLMVSLSLASLTVVEGATVVVTAAGPAPVAGSLTCMVGRYMRAARSQRAAHSSCLPESRQMLLQNPHFRHEVKYCYKSRSKGGKA